MNIVIVDYGLGNTGSILNMLRHLEIDAAISNSIDEIKKAKRLILPGVGAFDHGMKNLISSGIGEVLTEMVMAKKIPVLGICLGMQLMTLRSSEGMATGMGWINASTIGFDRDIAVKLRVPHTGWNTVEIKKENDLLKDMPDDSRFYFVHSYHLQCHDKTLAAGRTHYGEWFDSVIAHENIFGCQFHPEKSHRFGMKIFENFNKI